jgi:hypothetical protein
MTYKIGDYIKVSTNQPVVHLSMVVDYDLNSENIADIAKGNHYERD